jgi:hypothetical protein
MIARPEPATTNATSTTDADTNAERAEIPQ